MALAAAKAAVQIGPLAGVGLQGAPDQVQGLVETPHQLRRDHVCAQGVGWPRHALGEAQNKIALVHLGGNVKDVADGGHIRPLFASFTGVPTIDCRCRRVLRDGIAQFATLIGLTQCRKHRDRHSCHAPYNLTLSLFTVFLKNGFFTALSSITSTLRLNISSSFSLRLKYRSKRFSSPSKVTRTSISLSSEKSSRVAEPIRSSCCKRSSLQIVSISSL